MLDTPTEGSLEASPDNGSGVSSLEPAPCRGIRWHVFHTRPNYERMADLALRRMGMETYLPLQIERWHGQDRHIVVVFPRYTFARFDVNAVEWGREAILRQGCGEVGRFLLSSTTRMPAPLDARGVSLIEGLRSEADKDGVIHPPEPRQMRRGDTGRVLAGPLAEFSGVCSRTSRDRVWLLLEILGRKSEVGFSRDAVEMAG